MSPFPPASPSAPQEKWFVAFPDGRKIGPVSRQQMMAAMQSGKVAAECKCLRSDWSAWRGADEVASKLGLQLPSSAVATNKLWDEVSPTDFRPPPPPPKEESHGPSILERYLPDGLPPPPVNHEFRDKVMTVLGSFVPYLIMVLVITIMGGPILGVVAIVPAAYLIFCGTVGVAIATFRWPWLVDGPLFYINRLILGKELAITMTYVQGVLLLIVGYGWTVMILRGLIMIYIAKYQNELNAD